MKKLFALLLVLSLCSCVPIDYSKQTQPLKWRQHRGYSGYLSEQQRFFPVHHSSRCRDQSK